MDIDTIGTIIKVVLGTGVVYLVYRKTRRKEQKIVQNLAAVKRETETSEKMAEPCNVSITRLSSAVAALASSSVFLNGNRVGALKNGATLNLATEYADNELTIRNPGNSTTRFEAIPGGLVKIEYSTKGAKGRGSLTLK